MTFDLNTIWFMLTGLLLIGYAILDGFDLGTGALHLLTKTDEERRVFLNAIGPVWDGNEVWLVTAGGALFAAFPEVYATSFSGFYLAMMLLLLGLIFRAVSIDIRSKQDGRVWRQIWDISFSLASILVTLLIGVALGNVAWGIGLNSQFEYAGDFWGLLNPYALLVGITALALFMMHGALYLLIKTEQELQARIKRWVAPLIIIFIVCYLSTTAATVLFAHHLLDNFKAFPPLFVLPLVNALVIVNIIREIYRGREFRAFLSSCATIALLLILLGIGLYPNLIFSRPEIANSLTIYNAASSLKTLKIMLIIAVIGMPLVISYTAVIYWIFRGKVKINSTSY